MTPDQRAALEILLDAQNVLDTDTQLMPLIWFVLFGTTGTMEPEPMEMVANPSEVDDFLSGRTRSLNLFCPVCGLANARQTKDGVFMMNTKTPGRCVRCNASLIVGVIGGGRDA